MDWKTVESEKGAVIVVVAAAIVVILGLCGLALDLGFVYLEKNNIQTACDSAALAGALKLPAVTSADEAAKEYAGKNGYVNGVNNVLVKTTPNPTNNHPDWFRVTIQKPAKLYFMRIFGFESVNVSTYATAQYSSYAPMNVWQTGTYGTQGVQTLEISGPMAFYDFGDPYGVKYMGEKGSTTNPEMPNPQYNPNGYNYFVNVPNNYQTINSTNQVKVELYDAPAGSKKSDGTNYDENFDVYNTAGKRHGLTNNYTNLATTVYSIYAPDDTPSDYSDDILIGTVTYNPLSGYSSTYSQQWVCPPNFQFNYQTYGSGNYRLNVKTISGTGENVFNLRAGPPVAKGKSFNPNNGTTVSAEHLEMFFTETSTVKVALGSIPSTAAGMKLHINKFDTDVGSNMSIDYTDSTGTINWTGKLSGNKSWQEDVFTIPSNYPGGTIYLTYSAGKSDTSVWEMWYEGVLQGQPAKLRLVE